MDSKKIENKELADYEAVTGLHGLSNILNVNPLPSPQPLYMGTKLCVLCVYFTLREMYSL